MLLKDGNRPGKLKPFFSKMHQAQPQRQKHEHSYHKKTMTKTITSIKLYGNPHRQLHFPLGLQEDRISLRKRQWTYTTGKRSDAAAANTWYTV